MDTSDVGCQPFYLRDDLYDRYRLCNGEIYNFHQLITKYSLEDKLKSHSDCELIGHIASQFGVAQLTKDLEGEFAIVILQIERKTTIKTRYGMRDPFGVRPLFRSSFNDELIFSSEAKGIPAYVVPEVFEPGTLQIFAPKHDGFERQVIRYFDIQSSLPIISSEEQAFKSIYGTLEQAVIARLEADRPLGCLLSGGLDSSLMSAIAQKHSSTPISTFTIGLEGGTDIEFAQRVADHIGSDHTTFIVTIQEALESIDKVIYTIESWDTTTIRASVWQYLLGKKIREHTDIKVLITGEGSDELTGGYLYFHKCPDTKQLHDENIRLLSDIHRFDGLRVDRAMACHGLEVRIPMLDPYFTQAYLSIDPQLRLPRHGIEKRLLRKACDLDLLPDEVLRRKKEAFSDGVSKQTKSWFEIIQEYIGTLISDEEYEEQRKLFTHYPPQSKEQYYYRKKFREYFGDHADHLIPYYRLPKWSGDQTDPSARILDIYKEIGNNQKRSYKL